MCRGMCKDSCCRAMRRGMCRDSCCRAMMHVQGKGHEKGQG